jgi:hypothetical protein
MNELKQKVTTAIKGLTRRNKIKLEYLQTIEIALSNPTFDDNSWLNILKNNANLALQEKIFTTEMVRLLTLRAIVFPETLPEFVTWMLQRKGEDQSHYQLCLDFQKQVLDLIKKIAYQAPYLSQKIDQGVLLIITSLLDKPDILKGALWLLQDKNSIWGKFYQNRIIKYIDYDLSLMAKCSRQNNYQQLSLSNEKNWFKLWQEIGCYWQANAKINLMPKYVSLAQLFEKLRNYRIAAFFYHISLGKVPKNVFGKLTKYSFCSVLSVQIYNLTVYRYVNSIELIILRIIDLFLFLELDVLLDFIKNKTIKFYYDRQPATTILLWKIRQYFKQNSLITKFLVSLLYLLMWVIIYAIFFAISQELKLENIMMIPVIMNLPLAIILGCCILLLGDIFFAIIIGHLLYFFYRFIWFKDKIYSSFVVRIGLRIREFFVWLIVVTILASVINILYYLLNF